MDIRNVKVGLVKTTTVNFPGHLAVAVFLPGCNLRCDYCYNGELACADVHGTSLTSAKNEYTTLDKVFEHLEKRQKLISALAISGGEALMSPYLEMIIKKAFELNYLIKLDTNGLFPEKLEKLLQEEFASKIKIVALDIKTAPSRYYELLHQKPESLANELEKKLHKTLNILKQAELKNRLAVEYRTVLVRNLVGLSEINEIAELLPKNADWQFANFLPGNCLNPKWNELTPYNDAELENLIQLAKSKIQNATLR